MSFSDLDPNLGTLRDHVAISSGSHAHPFIRESACSQGNEVNKEEAETATRWSWCHQPLIRLESNRNPSKKALLTSQNNNLIFFCSGQIYPK